MTTIIVILALVGIAAFVYRSRIKIKKWLGIK